MLDLSWGYLQEFGEYLGPPWSHVAPHGAILGQSWKNLGNTLVNLVLRKPCEVEIVNFTKVLYAFFEGARIKIYDSRMFVF